MSKQFPNATHLNNIMSKEFPDAIHLKNIMLKQFPDISSDFISNSSYIESRENILVESHENILVEYYTNGYNINTLDLLFILSILCGILVITIKNPITSVLFLIGLFFSIACYLLVQGTNFIGLSYLLVYVGAVSILFLFILMLINIRVSELSSDTSNSISLSVLIGFIFYSTLHNIIPDNFILNTFNDILKNIYGKESWEENRLSYVTSKSWDGNLAYNSHINALGNIMYTNYFIWLILSSIILLLAMVGAIIITIKQDKQ